MLEQTQALKRCLNPATLARDVKAILDHMKDVNLNLPLFLDAICWGDSSCEQCPVIQFQRTALMHSEELPGILARCHRPPRKHAKGNKAEGGKQALENFAIDCVSKMIDREMNNIAPIMKSPPSQMNTESLTSISFEDIMTELQSPSGCPTLWSVLRRASYCKRQEKRNSTKNPDLAVMMQICVASYCRSHHRCRIPKLLSMYLKVCGASARSLDVLHSFGLTMSHRWIYDGMETLANSSMKKLKKVIKNGVPWYISHDNLNIPFRVFEQRIDNQSHFDNGTAATIYLAKDLVIPPLSNPELCATRASGSEAPFRVFDVLQADTRAGADFHERDIRRVLRFLTDSPEFSFETYRWKDSDVFAPHSPVDQLPCGQEHITEQYMLATVHMEEASYAGNSDLIEEWFRQLGLDSEEEKKRTGTELVIPWIGDQLTVSRLRGLFNFRSEDFNAFDRMDYLLVTFGWFHTEMTFATSIHDQYLGTVSGHGLRQAFEVLKRKGLNTTSTKGPFHHHLEEAIFHVGEAHFRSCWLEEAGVDNIKALRSKAPEELRSLAERIIRFHASTEALVKHDQLEDGKQDEVRRHVTMWNRDVLRYFDLSDAIKYGDIGIMEQHLPHLLLRFTGGKNSKYALEICELLQGLWREWPEDAKNFIKRHCWLANSTGRRDGFCPIDMAQEHNVRDIKYTFSSLGPLATWDYLKKISPAIPTFRAVKDHIEFELRALGRGKRHTSPAKEDDIDKLSKIFTHAQLHRTVFSRKFKNKADKSPDFVAKGLDKILTTNYINTWWTNRTYMRETDNDWEDITTEQHDETV
ncbi:hypothetical protein BD410DRAFT_709862 [Rickenella mellea]|uniref:DUF6589 domain-containing protein n=1 Tax=Rickenella mellea TaxID=50990 RepID=A0A4R5XGB6_9AGAM|nr:hypothetical protein BD410DRAFT_709862 [Rickenella mellea]